MASVADIRNANARQVAALNLELELAEIAAEFEVQHEARASIAKLAKSHRDLLVLICKGMTDPELKVNLHRHDSSIRRSKTMICKNMGVRTIAEAAYVAALGGLR